MNKIESNPRYQEVIATLERGGFGQFFNGKRKTSMSLSEEPAKRLRKSLEHIGGGFLLGGIFLAHRIDLLDAEYCKELNKIRDRDLSIPFHEIERTIIHSYSRPVNTIFSKIWAKATESDILTQTHKAILTNGEVVFVKIIKEKTINKIKEDIMIAKYLAEKTNNKIFKKIVDEFQEHFNKKKTLETEKKFLSNSAKAYGSNYLPTPKEEISNSQVLVFSYEKNTLRKENPKNYKNILAGNQGKKIIEDDIKTIKGELLLLIIGILITIITLGLRGTINNLGGIIGVLIIVTSLVLNVKNKLRK